MTQQTFSQWTLPTTNGVDSLTFESNIPLSSIQPLGRHEVLVNLKAAALNYRDLMIAKGLTPGQIQPNIIPGSDGSGIVLAVGPSVSDFKAGDKVVTHMCPSLPKDQPASMTDISAGLGQTLPGTFRTHGIFPSTALVRMPSNLSFEQASTLTCSGLTAYNALFGLSSHAVKKGDWILVPGTGGVSIAALQFAVAAGATVVATTSSDVKAGKLKELGAKHIVNYRREKDWGESAKALLPSSYAAGFDLVLDLGGNETLPQSLAAVRPDGLVVCAGVLGKADAEMVPMMSALWRTCVIRGLLLGTRQQFLSMNKFIEEKDVRPVFDDEKVFKLEEAKEAFALLERQGHFSKVVVTM
ncbi:hypothetical protein LTR62_003510 [Meristemomyces frigidus]|uniref:Enoyl reductase (ER) domain-containing protein n=1 Tax=Meristemomyces frigidus TaxID=1508187 RepID=A0AAN7YKN4_9PEZI|nr:hypothetical protein LTR62_003510 [Meristemomyces frigidus]